MAVTGITVLPQVSVAFYPTKRQYCELHPLHFAFSSPGGLLLKNTDFGRGVTKGNLTLLSTF
jgi:hypothetical protein